MAGAGRWSVDGWIVRRLGERTSVGPVKARETAFALRLF